MEKLTYLSLWSNDLKFFPASLPPLLSTLKLVGNDFTSLSWDLLAPCQESLVWLDLSSNYNMTEITAPQEETMNFPKLEKLDLNCEIFVKWLS